ncbi:MAG: hypothetical protein QF357_10745, partial [Dehalococcoidia bacterium]|nr:hypothetical protein [Dehalococcoidia bacterium]
MEGHVAHCDHGQAVVADALVEVDELLVGWEVFGILDDVLHRFDVLLGLDVVLHFVRVYTGGVEFRRALDEFRDG